MLYIRVDPLIALFLTYFINWLKNKSKCRVFALFHSKKLETAKYRNNYTARMKFIFKLNLYEYKKEDFFRIEDFLKKKWSVMQDSNLRPLGPKPSALPSCANHRHLFYFTTIF